MDKKITQSQVAKTQQSSAAQPPKKSVSPMKLLKGLAGATVVGKLAKEAQATAQKMGDALASQKTESTSQLKAPELPKVEKQSGVMGVIARAAEKARSNPGAAHETRRAAEAQAQKTTVSGAPFNLNDDVDTLFKAGHNNKLGTDEKAIRELMWDRTPEQRKAIAESYKDRHQRDLWKDLDKEFEDPNDKRMMKAFREGDNVSAAAAALVDATTGQTSKKRVREVLERLSPEEASKAQEEYKKLHPKGRDLKAWTDKKFKGERGEQVDALLKGDTDTAQVAEMQRSLRKKNGAEVVAELRNMSAEERAAFAERFNSGAGEGQDLESLVGKLKGTNRDQAKALLAGNEAAADAALIQDAVDGMGSNKQKLWDGLGADIKDPQERQAYMQKVEAEYNKRYGPESSRKGKSLQERLKSELGGENEEKALVMLKQGEVPPAQQMKFALNGSRKDGRELASLIEQHGPEKARQMYAEATKSEKYPEGRDLDLDVQNRLGGTGRYEAKDALKGKPETAEEKVARTVARTEFETSGVAGRLAFSDEVLKKNTQRAEHALEQLQAARAAGDENAVAEWTTRIDELTGYAKSDTEVFRSEKQAVVDTTAAVAAGVAAAGAIAVTGGAAAPLVAMAAGATVNYGTRNVMAGRSYDQNNASKDLLVGAMEGIGVKGGALVGGIVKNRVQSQIRNKTAKKFAGNVAEGASDGLVGGAVMGTAETALAEGTWDNGIASGLGKVAEGGATGGAFGTVLGGGIGGGLSGAEEVLSKVRSKGPAVPEDKILRSGDTISGPEVAVTKDGPPLKTESATSTPASDYNYTRPKSYNPENSAYDPADLARELREAYQKNLDELGPEAAQKYSSSTEWSVIRDRGSRLLREAHEQGRISAEAVTNREVQRAINFRLAKDLRAGGVQLDPENVKSFTPVGAVKKKVQDPDKTPELQSTEVETYVKGRDGIDAIMISQRVLEPSPARATEGSKPVNVYNGSPRDLTTVNNAVKDMDEHAPELMNHLHSIHMTKSLGESISRKPVINPDTNEPMNFNPETGKPVRGPIDGRKSTNGMVFAHDAKKLDDSSGSMLIKKAPMFTGEGVLKKHFPDGIPEGLLRETSVKGTIYHEAAHLLDRSKAVDGTFWSERPGSPFLQNGELRRDDFVSDYAMTNAKEDFAETARFVTELGARKNPDLLEGKELTPALRRKLVETAEVIGADPKILERIDGWSSPKPSPADASGSSISSSKSSLIDDSAPLSTQESWQPTGPQVDTTLPKDYPDKTFGHGFKKHGPPGAEGVAHQAHREKFLKKGREGQSFTWFESEEAFNAAVKEAPEHLEVALKDPVKKAQYEAWLENARPGDKFGFRFTSDSIKGQGVIHKGGELVEQGNESFNGAYVRYLLVQQGSDLVPKLHTIFPQKVNEQ